MHHILERQFKRCFGEHAAIPTEWIKFLNLVSDTYTNFDEDRSLLDRSFEISSKEFRETNALLKESRGEIEQQAQNLELEVTERTKQLTEAKAKDEALLKSIGDGVIATNRKGEIIFINNIAAKLLDSTIGDITGKPCAEVISLQNTNGKEIPNNLRPTSLALNSGKTTSITSADNYYFVSKNGRKFPVAIIATPAIINEEIIGTTAIFKDITKEKEIDKAKNEFISLASHQLRTPLTTVNWYAEMLLAGDAGKINEEQKKYLNEIYKNNQRMDKLVNTLLNVSRIEMGALMIEPTPTNIGKLILSILDEQKLQINNKKIVILTSFKEKIRPTRVDPKFLRIAIQNLLSNAIKYTPEKGTIKIDLKTTKKNTLIDKKKINKDSIVITVSDNGYGIPKNQQDKIFGKLFRASNAKKKNPEGTGLGLYISKGIIERLNGQIWLNSEENKGTTFYVILPVAKINN
jgi:PAS domain S-box-containing protein